MFRINLLCLMWLCMGLLLQITPTAPLTAGAPSSYRLIAESSIATGHTGPVNSVDFSPDGHYLATASADTLLKVWQLSSSVRLAAKTQASVSCSFYNYPLPLVALSWSPDSTLLATGDTGGGLKLWKLPCDRTPTLLQGHQGAVRAVAFSPDGRSLASGGADNVVRLWDIASRQLVYSYDNGRYGINDLHWSPDGSRLAFVSTSGQLGLLTIAGASSQLAEFRTGSGDALRSLAFSPDGHWLAAGDSAGGITLWDSTKPEIQLSFRATEGAIAIHALDFSADSQFLASGAGDGSLKLWKISIGPNASTVADLALSLPGHKGPVRGVSFGPNSLLASASDDHTVRLWDTTNASLKETLAQNLSYQTTTSWLPDGSQVVSGANDGRLRVWRGDNGQPLRTLIAGGPETVVRASAFSSNGRWLAVTTSDGKIKLWDWNQNQADPFFQLTTSDGVLLSVAFAPQTWADGSLRLATGSINGLVRLWKWDGVQLQKVKETTIPSRAVRTLAFSPDGQFLATGSDDGRLRLWDIGSLQLIREVRSSLGYIKNIAFGPEGKTLASAGLDGSVRLWQLPSVLPIRAVQFSNPVESLAFSADGQALVAATDDGTLHVFNPLTSLAYFTISGQGLMALSIAFAPGSSSRLAAVTQDGVMQLWELNLGVSDLSSLPAPAQNLPALDKTSQFVQVENKHLVLGGVPITLKGFNFYPHLAPWGAMWQHWDGAQVATDLDKASELGANVLRVLIPYGTGFEWTSSDGTPQPEMLDELDQLLALASQRGMRVLVTLFDFYGDFPLSSTPDETANWRYLDTLTARYLSDPRVLGWDIHNEPDNYTIWQSGNQAQVQDWLARMAQRLRTHDPNHFITIGFGNSDTLLQAGPNGVNSLALSDVVSLHIYDPANLEQQLNEVQANGGSNVPVILEEFGWPSGPTELTETYSEATQAQYYQRSLDTITQRSLAGLLAWNMWDFTPNSVLNLKPDIAQQFFGLVRLNGSLKPAAQVWQQAYPASSLALPPAWLKPPTLSVRAVDPNLYPLYFPETGLAVPTPFKEYWNRMGGLESYGYPISGVRLEGGFLVQYFERARLEYHPEAMTAPDYTGLPRQEQLKRIVMLGLLGEEWLNQQGRRFGSAPPEPTKTYFAETQHNLGGRFKVYWETHGGLARFGFPLSEEIEESSKTDGQSYKVQYFERGRFEYHPEAVGTAYEIELGQLGRELLRG